MEIELTKTVRGKKLILRSAKKEDIKILLQSLKDLNQETKFLSSEPEEIKYTEEGELSFINALNSSEKSVMLLAFVDDRYIGNCMMKQGSTLRSAHRATIGIAIYQKYTHQGFGEAMLEALFEIATQAQLEQLELNVVSSNKPAISLYTKLGFKQYGCLPHQMKYRDGGYADDYVMIKFIKGND